MLILNTFHRTKITTNKKTPPSISLTQFRNDKKHQITWQTKWCNSFKRIPILNVALSHPTKIIVNSFYWYNSYNPYRPRQHEQSFKNRASKRGEITFLRFRRDKLAFRVSFKQHTFSPSSLANERLFHDIFQNS